MRRPWGASHREAGHVHDQRSARVTTGILVTPHSGNGLTQAQVEQIINQGIAQANKTRAAIRLPVGGATAGMVFSVSDLDGNVLGLYRMTMPRFFQSMLPLRKAAM